MIRNKSAGIVLKAEYLWTIALILFFTINMNYEWRTVSYIWYGCLLFVAAAYIVAFNGRIVSYLSPFIKWLISFICLGAVSSLWCISTDVVLDIVKVFIVILVVILLVQFSIDFGYKINTMLIGYFLATAINSIYIFSTIDVEKLGDVQLGTGLIDGWNGNGIGFMTAQGAFIGVYLTGQCKTLFGKIFFLAGTATFSFLTMYTGSRTAFIMLVVGFVLYFWMCNPKKIVRNAIITSVILYGALYLIMNVESFYNVLGVRMEGLFSLFSGEGKADSSASIRDVFIENGIRWFKETPLLGRGLNNYKVLNKAATGRFTYAHNNFVEIAVNLGAVGFVWYYSVYIYLGIKMLRNTQKNQVKVFLLTWLIASLISHYGNVCYYDFTQNFMLMLCFYAVNSVNDGRIDNSK